MTNFSLLQWQLSTPQKLKLDKTLFSALDAQLHSSPRQILLRFTKWLEILPVLPQSMPIVLTTIEIVRSPFSKTCEHQNPSWKQPPYTEFSTPNCSSNRKKNFKFYRKPPFSGNCESNLKKKSRLSALNTQKTSQHQILPKFTKVFRISSTCQSMPLFLAIMAISGTSIPSFCITCTIIS